MSLKSNSKLFAAKAWKWYVGGFRHTPDVPLIRSPRFIRLMLTLFFIQAVAYVLDTEGMRSAPVASSRSSASDNSSSYILTEGEAYQKCRNHFSNKLDLPASSPVYILDANGTSLVVNEVSTNGGKVTHLGDGRTIVAGQALIERDESNIKTRQFTCWLDTSTGSFSELIRGGDSSWQ